LICPRSIASDPVDEAFRDTSQFTPQQGANGRDGVLSGKHQIQKKRDMNRAFSKASTKQKG
tara:strand:- start:145 stop:327 length:183 start_codon:yes stop_codon:yes gene_type:complete